MMGSSIESYLNCAWRQEGNCQSFLQRILRGQLKFNLRILDGFTIILDGSFFNIWNVDPAQNQVACIDGISSVHRWQAVRLVFQGVRSS